MIAGKKWRHEAATNYHDTTNQTRKNHPNSAKNWRFTLKYRFNSYHFATNITIIATFSTKGAPIP